MVAVKAHQAKAFLTSPDRRFAAFLIYGTDAGLIHERAQNLARDVAGRESPPGEILHVDETDLESNAERLALELRTVPMFGGRKIVLAASGRRVTSAVLKPLVDGALEGVLIVEAGNLKPDDAMRALFEKSDRAAAIACYSDEAPELEAVVREVVHGAGLTIGSEARDILVGRLGADRALTRRELEKLVLYCAGKTEIAAGDIEAIVGDASELALERIFLAAASGDAVRAVAELGRAVAAGESPQAIVAATQRHFQRLHRVRAAMDQGRPLEDALRQLRPPLYFKHKDAFAAQCRAWTSERLAEALRAISATLKASRLSSALEEALAERLVMGLAELAARARSTLRS